MIQVFTAGREVRWAGKRWAQGGLYPSPSHQPLFTPAGWGRGPEPGSRSHSAEMEKQEPGGWRVGAIISFGLFNLKFPSDGE